MVLYRRNRVPGGTYFFTVTLRDCSSRRLVHHIDSLRQAFRSILIEQPFQLDAIVVLPDHLHAMWTLPDGDADYASRWRALKSRFTHALQTQGVSLQCDARGEYRLWQRRYWEHTIRDATDRQRHVDYIHYNPVKHGLVKRVADWPFSSFHRFVKQGWLPLDWAGGSITGESGYFGE